jgi:Fe-S-cluster-containing hydrogenase component 2
MACTGAHEGCFNPRHSRLRLPLTFPIPSTPVVCVQCKNPKCVTACPSGALERKDDVVAFDESACTACGNCVESCPFHAIWLTQDKIYKCDLCRGEASCVKFCPAQAISVMG